MLECLDVVLGSRVRGEPMLEDELAQHDLTVDWAVKLKQDMWFCLLSV